MSYNCIRCGASLLGDRSTAAMPLRHMLPLGMSHPPEGVTVGCYACLIRLTTVEIATDYCRLFEYIA
ncbi:hypothetical protein RHIZ404_220071 [Rhizobium sp. EC-SD404]|nr:hypothetical protein RHIZ404_220071 [Rhizobium sp. EC-SD404]